jgi:hypothetical protein
VLEGSEGVLTAGGEASRFALAEGLAGTRATAADGSVASCVDPGEDPFEALLPVR